MGKYVWESDESYKRRIEEEKIKLQKENNKIAEKKAHDDAMHQQYMESMHRSEGSSSASGSNFSFEAFLKFITFPFRLIRFLYRRIIYCYQEFLYLNNYSARKSIMMMGLFLLFPLIYFFAVYAYAFISLFFFDAEINDTGWFGFAILLGPIINWFAKGTVIFFKMKSLPSFNVSDFTKLTWKILPLSVVSYIIITFAIGYLI